MLATIMLTNMIYRLYSTWWFDFIKLDFSSFFLVCMGFGFFIITLLYYKLYLLTLYVIS